MVSTCAHNQGCYCVLDKVEVGGKNANTACMTCCDSFVERKEGEYVDSVKEATPTCSINCNASECKYNEGCSCTAGNVNVQGVGACTCKETECSTFCCK